MKQNITLYLEKDLIARARVLAAQRSTSVSRLLAEKLAEVVNGAEAYDRARRRALADLDRGYHWGGRPAKRDELHLR